MNISAYSIVDYIVIGIFASLAVYFVFSNKIKKLVYLAPFALGFTTFFVNFATKWSPPKIVGTIFIVGLLLRSLQQSKSRGMWHKFYHNPFGIYIVGFVFTMIFTTIFNYTEVNSFAFQSIGFWQSTGGRCFIQLFSYITSIAFFYIAYLFIDDFDTLETLVKCCIVVATILAIYGIYQYIAMKTGLPFRGIVYTSEKARAGLMSGLGGARINSLSWEPKALGNFMITVVSCIAIFFMRKQKLFKIKNIEISMIVVFSAVVILTWSTSVFYGAILTLPALIFYGAKKNKYFIVSLFALGLLCIIAVGPLVEKLMNKSSEKQAASAGAGQSMTWEEIYEERVSARVTEERAETFFLEYAKQHPIKVAIGLGPGNYNFYVGDYLPGRGMFSGGYFDLMTSMPLILVADGGILAILLLGLFLKKLVKKTVQITNHFPREHVTVSLALVLALVTQFFASCFTMDFAFLMFLSGVLAANIRIGIRYLKDHEGQGGYA